MSDMPTLGSLFDSIQKYLMWGNGMALPNALYIMEGVADAFAEKNPCKKMQEKKQ